MCNATFEVVNDSIVLPEVASEHTEEPAQPDLFVATGIDAYPLVFLVDKKTALVSFLAGIYIAWLAGWGGAE